MSARVLDGKAIAAELRAEVAAGVQQSIGRGITPGLAVVLVGSDPASEIYVRSKGKACIEAGMHSETIKLPAEVAEAELLAVIDRLNADPAIHGILCQMPLPKHLDPDLVIRRIDPAKDVDGFHPVNVGKLVLGDPTGFVPCTPAGVVEILVRSGIATAGAEAVVVGRSTIVGRPMANLLMRSGRGGDATVTVAHSRTRNLVEVCRRADILVAAVGRAEFIGRDAIKPGATVIDVGINRVVDPSRSTGYRVTGDVDPAAAAELASAYTPVPGGVGPMTIAMLLRNTLTSAERLVAG